MKKQDLVKFIKQGFVEPSEKTTFGDFKQLYRGMEISLLLNNSTIVDRTKVNELSFSMFGDMVMYKLLPTTPPLGTGDIYEDDSAEEVLTHPLYPIFMAAIHQAIHGKGERHGGGKTPFMEQSWLHLTKKHGNGFLTGQACKKIEEAAETRTGEAFDTEVLGAINYAAMAIIHRRMGENDE